MPLKGFPAEEEDNSQKEGNDQRSRKNEDVTIAGEIFLFHQHVLLFHSILIVFIAVNYRQIISKLS